MADVLQTLSNDLAALVEAAGPSVVRVEGRKRLPATGVVWSADGVIVTAAHVITREENLRVGLADGETVAAALAGVDPATDLAVLRAEASNLAAASWVESEDLRVGQLVLALGRPGQTVQATLGVVSAVGGSWRTAAGGKIDQYVQTDVLMYPGFSGGPLAGAGGAFLGLNSSGLLRGVSVALPGATVARVTETLLAHGRVRRGYLGIGSQPVRLPEALAEEIGQETGVMIMSIEPGSPADQGGLVMGDTIVALDGESVRHMDDLQALLGGDRVGQTVPVSIVRGGQLTEIAVTLGERG